VLSLPFRGAGGLSRDNQPLALGPLPNAEVACNGHCNDDEAKEVEDSSRHKNYTFQASQMARLSTSNLKAVSGERDGIYSAHTACQRTMRPTAARCLCQQPQNSADFGLLLRTL
jgi:hypothetical protein